MAATLFVVLVALIALTLGAAAIFVNRIIHNRCLKGPLSDMGAALPPLGVIGVLMGMLLGYLDNHALLSAIIGGVIGMFVPVVFMFALIAVLLVFKLLGVGSQKIKDAADRISNKQHRS